MNNQNIKDAHSRVIEPVTAYVHLKPQKVDLYLYKECSDVPVLNYKITSNSSMAISK